MRHPTDTRDLLALVGPAAAVVMDPETGAVERVVCRDDYEREAELGEGVRELIAEARGHGVMGC